LGALLAVAATGLVWAATANAGYAIKPAAGDTTGPTPTFLVYLDSGDSTALVHVGTTAEINSSGWPVHDAGFCSPTTPWVEANKYTCQDSAMRLAPGTYYWWLSFWKTDPGNTYSTQHISGPFAFTVAPPTSPPNAGPVTPTAGETVGPTPTLVAHAPANAEIETYVSDSSQLSSDGTPAGGQIDSCDVFTSAEGDYTCEVTDPSELTPGATYYWWVVIVVDGNRWPYPVRTFTVKASSGGGGGGGGGGGPPVPHDASFAPYLPSAAHYRGAKSIKQTRLSKAAYVLSKYIGSPKTVAVACWDTNDWTNITHDNPESAYSVLGFWQPSMPRWLQLSPGICRTMETLLYHRPAYPNRYTANAVDTLTHEMIHALGVRSEAATECFAMQLNWITADVLGVPIRYSTRLSHLSLGNYRYHPASYVDPLRCREDGVWDIWKNTPSLPWHDFQV
jgi:hypothetical protein